MDKTWTARDQSGSVLLATVLAMLLLTVLALSLAMVGTLEGKIAVNHYALVKALHVADGGIEGVKRELTDYINANGWTGTWTPVLAARGAVCNPVNGVTFSDTPTAGAAWSRTGASPTLFIRDNDTSLGVTWENGNACTDSDGVITIRADGRIGATAGAFGASQPVAVDIGWRVGGPSGGWENAVNGGGGPPGTVVNGNAMVYGGVLLTEAGGGVVWAMGGTSGIRNNYQNGADAPSSEKLRDSTRLLLNPTLLAEGDVSLNAGFYVKRGTVVFSGGSTAGLSQASVTNRKQTLDTALANDFDPAAVNEIHADRVGPFTGIPGFPLLSDVVGGGDTRTWEVMLNQDGLHFTPAEILAACKPPPEAPDPSCRNDVIDGNTGLLTGTLRTFCKPMPCGTDYTSPTGVQSRFNLIVDLAPNPNTATLVVKGIIVFDNFGSGQGLRIGGLTGGGPESLGEIVYSGSASIFVDDALPNNCTGATPCAGRLTLAADIKTLPLSFPTAVNPPVYPPDPATVNTLGFMADQIGIAYGADGTSITGVGSSPAHTGLFYAQSQLFMCKSTEVFGSLFSPQVTMSCQVPKIAAVKTLSRFLPRGLIGSGGAPSPGTLVILRWREGTQ